MKKLFTLLILLIFIAGSSLGQTNYFTSFDGCNQVTCSGWNISGGFSPNITSIAGSGYSPCNTSSAKSNIYSGSTTTTLVSQVALGNSTGSQITVSFIGKAVDYGTGLATPAASCNITASWSTSSTGTYTTISSLPNQSSASCLTYTFAQFTPPAGQPIFIKFVAQLTSGDFWMVFDDITVGPLSMLPNDPLSFTATPASTTQIDLTWTLNGNGNPVMLVWNSTNTFGTPVAGTPYGVGATIPGGGTVLQNNTNTSYSHTSLSPATPYYYKAFSVGSGIVYSSGVTANATTLCDAYPQINENFELSAFPPLCWSLVAGSGSWTRSIAASGYGSGTASAFANFFNISGSVPFDLISPTFSASNAVLAFDHAYCTYETEVDQLLIYYSTNGGSTYTLLVTLNGGETGELVTAPPNTSFFTPTSSQWASKSYPLPAGANKVKFQAISAFGNNLYLDNIFCGTPPAIDLRFNNFYQVSGIPIPLNLGPGSGEATGKRTKGTHERHDYLTMLEASGKSVPTSQGNFSVLVPVSSRSTSSIMLADINITAEIENIGEDPASYTLNWDIDGVPQTSYVGPVVNPGNIDLANVVYPSPPLRGTFLATGQIDVVDDGNPGNNEDLFRLRVYPDVYGRTIYDRGDNDVDTYVGWNNPATAMRAGVRYTAPDYIKPVGVDFICRTETITSGTYTIEVRGAGSTTEAPGDVLYSQTFTQPVFFSEAGDYMHFAFDETLMPTIAAGSDYWITIECPLGVLYPGAAQGSGITPGRNYYYVASSDTWTPLVLSLVEYAWIMRSVHIQGEIPECPVPTDLSSSNVTMQGADLNWNYAVDSFFDIFIDLPGNPVPGPGTPATVSGIPATSYTWTDGAPGTSYNWWVRSDCGFNAPRVDFFWMAMTGGILDPLLSGATFDLAENEDGIWYNYIQAPGDIDWWNVWFYNDPLDLTRMKKIKMGFWIQPLNPALPANLNYVVNWSTDEWTGTGFPTPNDEAYIERSPVNGPVILQPGAQWLELSYIIADYNPEWVSVDIWGDNIQILEVGAPPPAGSQLSQYWVPGSPGGIIVHECLPKPTGNNSGWMGPATFVTNASNPTPCGLGLDIPDAGCSNNDYLEVNIQVSGAPGTQLGSDVLFSSASLIIDHTWDSDLLIYLESPSGIIVELSTDNGGSGDDYGDPFNCPTSVTTFAMDAINPITSGVAPFIGPYIPEGDLAAFHDGTNPNGIWTLLVCDDTGGDVGTVEYVALQFAEPPSCPAPTNLTASNVGAHTADIAWAAGDLETAWEYYYSTGPGAPAGAGIPTVTNPLFLTGLAENTTHYFYVRANCGTEFSTWAGPLVFTTLASCPAPTGLAVDNIDYTSAELSWIPGGDELNWNVEVGLPGFTPGTGNAVSSALATYLNPWTAEPLEPGTAYQAYVQAVCGFDQPKKENFWIAIDQNSDLVPALSGGAPVDDPGEDGIYYFYQESGTPWYNVWFYNGELDLTRMKIMRMGFWAQSYTGDEGTISYVINWSDDQWQGTGFPGPDDEDHIERTPVNGPVVIGPVPTWFEVYYVIPDYNPEWVSVDLFGENVQILYELTPPPMESPLYNWWMQDQQRGGILLHECLPKPVGDVSLWTGPVNFATPCYPITNLPYAQGFEDPIWPPDCWSDPVTAIYGWNRDVYGGPHYGSHWAYCNLAGSELFSPEFAIANDQRLTFWYRAEGSSYPQDMQVKINGNVVHQITGATNTTYQQVQIPLNAYAGQTIVISFLGQTGGGGGGWGICVDDFMITSFTNTWTGAVSTAWNDPANWSAGVVPGTMDHVIIPSAPTSSRFPVIGSGVSAECYEIFLNNGATFVIETGGTLNVINP